MNFDHLKDSDLSAVLNAQGIDPAYKDRIRAELARRSGRKLEGGTDVNVRVPAGRSERTATSRGRMNKTEAAFAEVLEMRRVAGDIREWEYEACKIRLADRTWWAPDFTVWEHDGGIAFYEVKGRHRKKAGGFYATDDAIVKAKVVAELYPVPVRIVWRDERMVWQEKLLPGKREAA